MTSEDQRRRREWERQFPALDDHWTHWWMEGDGALLAVVAAADLTVALDVVARYHERVPCIFAPTARVDSFGDIVREENHGWVIVSKTPCR